MTLTERLASLEPRERRLLNVMLGVAIAMVVLIAPVGLSTMARTARAENEALRGSIDALERARTALAKSQARRDALQEKYRRPAPTLASWLDRLARDSGLEIPESQDRAEVPHGKAFDERSTKILLRSVGMLDFARFMERIEKAPHPVVISRLNIRKRSTEPDSYNIEMIVSAFDRKQTQKKAKNPAGESAKEAERDVQD